jgi:hypothetical protein
VPPGSNRRIYTCILDGRIAPWISCWRCSRTVAYGQPPAGPAITEINVLFNKKLIPKTQRQRMTLLFLIDFASKPEPAGASASAKIAAADDPDHNSDPIGLFMSQGAPSQGDLQCQWIVDSGASHTMCSNLVMCVAWLQAQGLAKPGPESQARPKPWSSQKNWPGFVF